MYKKKSKTESPKDYEEFYEQRFNCMICMEPKLDMVYGQCQHKFCTDCLYVQSCLRSNMQKCPICGTTRSFPNLLPDIPDDNREAQKCLGIMECSNKERGCKVTMWQWELEDHASSCQFVKRTTSPRKSKKQKAVGLTKAKKAKLTSTSLRRSVRLMKK